MSGFYGLCTAMICCNQWLAGLHIFGIKHFSKAMGYLECIGGASTLAGGALLTYISKINGEEIDYQLMMSSAGGVFCANTLLALICFLITEHSRKREKEKVKRERKATNTTVVFAGEEEQQKESRDAHSNLKMKCDNLALEVDSEQRAFSETKEEQVTEPDSKGGGKEISQIRNIG